MKTCQPGAPIRIRLCLRLLCLLTLLRAFVTHAVSIVDYGAVQGADSTAAFRSALTNRHVVIPAGEWRVRGKLTNSQNSLVEGIGNPTVILEHSFPDWFLGQGTEMRGVRVSGRLALTNSVKLHDMEVFDAYMGVDARFSTNIHITDLRFHGIRNSAGWGSGLHFESCTNFFVDGVRGWDSDRGVEIENGSAGGVVQNGLLNGINPQGKIAYSFTLDVHTHPQEASCSDIVLRNFVVTNCFANISCEGKIGDLAARVRFENVAIVNPASSSSMHSIRIGGAADVILERVHCAGSPNSRPEIAWVFDESTQVSFVNCSFESVRERAILVQAGCSSVSISGCAFPTAQAVAAAPGTTTVFPQPVVRPQHLRNTFSRSAGYVRLEWQAEPFASLRVETSPDLVAWTPVSTNASPTGLVVMTQPLFPPEVARFYRLVP